MNRLFESLIWCLFKPLDIFCEKDYDDDGVWRKGGRT